MQLDTQSCRRPLQSCCQPLSPNHDQPTAAAAAGTNTLSASGIGRVSTAAAARLATKQPSANAATLVCWSIRPHHWRYSSSNMLAVKLPITHAALPAHVCTKKTEGGKQQGAQALLSDSTQKASCTRNIKAQPPAALQLDRHVQSLLNSADKQVKAAVLLQSLPCRQTYLCLVMWQCHTAPLPACYVCKPITCTAVTEKRSPSVQCNDIRSCNQGSQDSTLNVTRASINTSATWQPT